MGATTDISGAIAMLRQRRERSMDAPLIVCVHSISRDAGKTRFCATAADTLHKQGKYDVHTCTSPATNETLSRVKGGLEYFFYDAGSSMPSASLKTVLNQDVQPVFGREIDVFVYIFNPRATPHTLEQLAYVRNIYDIVIVNPHDDAKGLEYHG